MPTRSQVRVWEVRRYGELPANRLIADHPTIILSDHFPDLDVTQFAHILHLAINLAIEKLPQHWRVRLRLQHVRLAFERAVLGVGQ
jgi:hypothetical protein